MGGRCTRLRRYPTPRAPVDGADEVARQHGGRSPAATVTRNCAAPLLEQLLFASPVECAAVLALEKPPNCRSGSSHSSPVTWMKRPRRRLAARNQVRRLPHARPAGSREDPAIDPHRLRLVQALSTDRQSFRSVPVKTAYLDGQLCALRPDRVLAFGRLQPRCRVGRLLN